MPEEYDVLDVTRFAYRYERWGENLRNYSHPQVCIAMRLLTKKKRIIVSEIHDELDRLKISPSNLSSFLKDLHRSGHVNKKGRLYELVNNIFYKRLCQSAYRIKNYQKTKKWKSNDYSPVSNSGLRKYLDEKQDLADEDVASVAKVFSDIFYEESSNYLIHILLKQKLTFNEIVNIYQNNHGYVQPDRLRYYLSSRKLTLFNKKFSLFSQKDRRFTITRLAEIIHKTFDESLDFYMLDSEKWMEKLWKNPAESLISEITSIVHPADPFFKVLRLLAKSGVVLVQSHTIVGIVTVKDALNKMNEELGNPGWWTYVSAKDVMHPVTESEFILKSDTMTNVLSKKETLDQNYYIVKLAENSFGVLDISEFQKLLNCT